MDARRAAQTGGTQWSGPGTWFPGSAPKPGCAMPRAEGDANTVAARSTGRDAERPDVGSHAERGNLGKM
jgi:hypothetical protein